MTTNNEFLLSNTLMRGSIFHHDVLCDSSIYGTFTPKFHNETDEFEVKDVLYIFIEVITMLLIELYDVSLQCIDFFLRTFFNIQNAIVCYEICCYSEPNAKMTISRNVLEKDNVLYFSSIYYGTYDICEDYKKKLAIYYLMIDLFQVLYDIFKLLIHTLLLPARIFFGIVSICSIYCIDATYQDKIPKRNIRAPKTNEQIVDERKLNSGLFQDYYQGLTTKEEELKSLVEESSLRN
ncbi:MAG: hypothetical protein CMF41_06005 [Legionellales bacterium]|nr:hypothetical protein [Legionellales bacterium]OUX64266.1 MAG: hypothetical protein CBE41_03620 [Gammaproteobacteria bacterium TMED281]